MKKRLLSILCMVCVVFSLTACSFSKESSLTVEDKDNMKAVATQMIAQCMMLDDASYEQIMNYKTDELDMMLISSGAPVRGKNYQEIFTSWRNGIEEVGEIDPTSISEFTISEKNKEVILTAEAKFAQRSADITFTFEPDGEVTSLTIGGHYSIGEILKKAGMNTIIGMGTCFCVLIFISLIISTFGFFGKVGKKKPEPKSEAPAVKEAPAPKVVAAEPKEPADDLELIAVISAAIAEYEGQEPGRITSVVKKSGKGSRSNEYVNDPSVYANVDGFAARSIRRSGNWKR